MATVNERSHASARLRPHRPRRTDSPPSEELVDIDVSFIDDPGFITAIESEVASTDYHRLHLPEDATMEIVLRTAGSVVGLELRRSLDTDRSGAAGEVMNVTSTLVDNPAMISLWLSAGEYFVRVHSLSGGLAYGLCLTAHRRGRDLRHALPRT